MDYDRHDALLHWLFRHTQGDAWLRPAEDGIASAVVLRVSAPTAPVPEFRVFPYETASLEPFETAVSALNPLVAVKVRTAAVHAALAECTPDERSIVVDADARIQILDTMLLLPSADRDQCAAFIRDERVLVVWSESIDRIVPLCQDIDDRLIKLLWRAKPAIHSSISSATAAAATPMSSAEGHSSEVVGNLVGERRASKLGYGYGRAFIDDEFMPASENEKTSRSLPMVGEEHDWDAKRDIGNVENAQPELRAVMLYAPVYNGIAAGLACLFVGNGVKVLLVEISLDGNLARLGLLGIAPFLFCVSLFFAMQMVQNVSMSIGPIAQFYRNSKYYSAVKPIANKEVDSDLPHITIQMPVYKESLETVLKPSIESLKKAMQTYARQGGTSNIFVNDDGLRLLPAKERDERIVFYTNHNIGWVARPAHDERLEGFKRAGRFKKASNMNYGLRLSLKVEKHLEELQASSAVRPSFSSGVRAHGAAARPGCVLQGDGGVGGCASALPHSLASMFTLTPAPSPASDSTLDPVADLEELALGLAIEELYAEGGGRAWAANGRGVRVGELILLVDADTLVPEDCLRDAAREMRECPEVGVLQHESDVMQVAHHYFENGIAYFTRRINRCISIACANGEVAPFMGHNAFLRWKALQDAAFVDPVDGFLKIWSEENVSEDFDMALRLMRKGFIVRWATYSRGGFKEGVSLSVDDELNRWQKYAYGCNELLFNPIIQWWRRGPIAPRIHHFLWSAAPMHYKISMMSYMFSYYGIAASVTISVVNYVLLGLQLPVDGYFMHSFEVWLATTVVFWGSGTVGYTLLEYRLGNNALILGLLENLMWIPFFFFFFGGLSIPLSQALLAHLFSYNIQWTATVKEVQRSNFFKEIPKIAKRFWFPLIMSIVLLACVVVCATPLVPIAWRVDSGAWAVIFPVVLIAGCHILFPIVLNPWLMVFSY